MAQTMAASQRETRTGAPPPSIQQSLKEYGRGVGGGLLFSLPLLYTMEVWWFGFIITPPKMILYILVTFLLLLGYNRHAGMRRDSSWVEVVIDSIEEMGLGIVIAAGFLALLGRITLDMPMSEIVGKTVIEAMTVAIGVSVGTAQLGAPEPGDSGMSGDGDGDEAVYKADQHLVLAFIGAILIAGNIAPTEEVVMLGIETSSLNLIGLLLLSILVGGLILFFSDFIGTRVKVFTEAGAFMIVRRTLINYAVALTASGLILWFFGRFDNASSIAIISQTVVLGAAATLGASAGRLLIK